MKKKLLLVSTLLLSLSQAFSQYENAAKGQTPRTLPIHENFDYTVGENLCMPEGSLKGQWASPVDNNVDDVIVESPSWLTTMPYYSGNALYIQGGNTDPQLLFTSTNSGSIYMSFVCKITEKDPTSLGNGGERFIGLGQPSTSTIGNTNSTASFYFQKTGTDTYKLGITRASTLNDVEWGTASYTFGTELYIVIRYDIDPSNSTVHLHVIPNGGIVPAAEPTTATIFTQKGSSRSSVNAVMIRQNGNSTTPEVIIDELRVGTSWSSGTGTIPLKVAKNEVAGLNVYPNPVSNGVVYISSDSAEAKAVAVYDILGKQVIQKQVSNGSVDVSALSKAVYLMKVSEGAALSTKKIVIE